MAHFKFADPTIRRYSIQSAKVIILDPVKGLNVISGFSATQGKLVVFSSNEKMFEKQTQIPHTNGSFHFELVEKFRSWPEVCDCLDWYVSHLGSLLAKQHFDHVTIQKMVMGKIPSNLGFL